MTKTTLTNEQRYALKDALVPAIRLANPKLSANMVADNLAFYTSAILKMPISVEKLNSFGVIKINSKQPTLVLEDCFDEDSAVHVARLTRTELAKELVGLSPLV